MVWQILLWVSVGLFAGVLSGLFGIGGGLVIVPLLVLLFKMNQLDAQGTSLAVLLPPVGLLAALRYYKSGHVRMGMALWIALGLIVGALWGAQFATQISPQTMRKIYGVFLVLVGCFMVWR